MRRARFWTRRLAQFYPIRWRGWLEHVKVDAPPGIVEIAEVEEDDDLEDEIFTEVKKPLPLLPVPTLALPGFLVVIQLDHVQHCRRTYALAHRTYHLTHDPGGWLGCGLPG